ncbi:MAG: serine/threonine-protein kinase [Polyangiaceae bacterium]
MSARAASPAVAETTVHTLGRYELHDEIAAGGMASVYLGRMVGSAGFAKSVAIKRLHPHLAKDPDLVALLLDEARLMERVRHPNVVATLDVVSEGNELLLVMEYVHGEPLWRLLRAAKEAGTHCPPEIAARIAHDVLLGLSAAHRASDASGTPICIIHRDVSPQNVMVGADGVARLVDFGIAKVMGTIGHTQEGMLKGKVPYMAPELLRFEPASPQTDVWALAVVLWEMRCSRRLFRGENDIEAWMKIMSEPIPDPATIVGTPDPIDDIILRGLSRDVTERYESARAMADDIERKCRIASPTEVAAWVEKLASASLASRAALLRGVEARSPVARAEASGPFPTSSGTPLPSELAAREPRSMTWRYAIPIVLVGAAAGFFVMRASDRRPAFVDRLFGRASAAQTETTSEVPSSRVVAVETTPSVASASASSSPTPAPASASALAPAPAASSATKVEPVVPKHRTPVVHRVDRVVDAGAAATVTTPAPPKRADCDPPYYVDESGRTRFKVDCLKQNQ